MEFCVTSRDRIESGSIRIRVRIKISDLSLIRESKIIESNQTKPESNPNQFDSTESFAEHYLKSIVMINIFLQLTYVSRINPFKNISFGVRVIFWPKLSIIPAKIKHNAGQKPSD